MRQLLTASAIYTLLITTSPALELEAQVNAEDIVSFVGGFLKGFVGNDYTTEINSCTGDI
jgi:hypothetical protein